MNSSINNKENIREYLLGRVANDSLLSELEELLFLDTDFFDLVELEQEELIHDYVFGRLSETDRNDFEKTLSANTQRKMEVELAQGLREKAKQARAAAPIKKRGFFEAIKASFKQPAYIGAFAVLLIALIAVSYVLMSRKNMDDLAELRSIYSRQRQTQARISGFDYAPFDPVRGSDTSEGDRRELSQIRDRLVDAARNDPSAKTYRALGVFYLHEGKFPQAIEEIELAIKAGPDSAELRNDLGLAYFEMGRSNADGKQKENLTRAVDECTKALQLNPDKLEALFNRALALQKMGQVNQARESWNQYLQKDPSSKWAEEARKKLEDLDRTQGSFKPPKQVLEDFLAAYRNRDDETAWKINSQTRNVLSGVWLPAQLSRRYIEAKMDRDPKEERENIDALTYIGTLEKERNADFFVSDLALSLARAGDAGARKSSDAHRLFDEGLELIKKGKNRPALESFETSARSFSEAGNEPGAMLARYWVMQSLSYLGRLRDGLSTGTEIIDSSRAKNYKWLEASAHYFFGIVLCKQDEFTQAMDSYLESLEGSKNAGDTLLEQRIITGIDEVFIETGEIQKALKYHFQNDDLYYSGEPLTQWRNSLFDAKVLLKLKLNGAAAEFAAESLAHARKTEVPDNMASSLLLMEECKVANNQLDDALSLAGQALAIVDKNEDDSSKFAKKGSIVLRIADLKSKLGKNEESLADYDQAIALFEKAPEIQLDNYAAHRGRLMRLRDLRRSTEVTAEIGTVLSLAEGFRRKIHDDESRQTFFDNEQDVFDIAIEDSLSRGDNIEAFQRAEKSKARSLLDMLAIDKLLKTVYVAEPLSADEIRAKMPADSQIVEYALLEDRLVAWVMSKEGVETVDLKIDTNTLNTNITELARLDRDRNSPPSRRNSTAADLYRTLIAPLSQFLDPAKTLVIVPDKSLYYVPFAALITEENKFLIERFTISNAPSSTIFVSTSQGGSTGDDRKAARLLSVGDPDFERDQFPGLSELDAAKDEAREIAGMMPGAKLFTGLDATKDAFMNALGNAQIVHFAGHYVTDPEVPSRSKLVFAGKNGGLRMSEITKKKIPNLQLVVLSACETGIDDVMRGEGAISASRAFLAAGAPVVVASQWKVDSRASAKLMVAFHRNRQRGLNSAAALKSAQMEMINDPDGPFTSPYYWAAFGVTGGLEN